MGGIGIVFDSEPQFAEMLRDSLPRNDEGEVAAGCFGIFADRKGRVISSTDPRFAPGSHLEVDGSFLSLPRGRGASRIIAFEGHYYAVGAQTSAGYREYKTEDGYVNDVVGLVFVPLAEVRERPARAARRRQAGMGVNHSRIRDGECIEVATFYIGDRWLGIRADKVLEAINSDGISDIPGMHDFVVGKIMHDDRLLPVLDIRSQLHLPEVRDGGEHPVVIMKAGETNVGLVVDALGEIPEVRLNRIDKGHSILDSPENYIDCIVKPEEHGEGQELLVVLEPARLVKVLVGSRGLRVPLPG